jgi:hypothetical protein
MGADRDTMVAILKEDYEDAIKNEVNDSTPAVGLFEEQDTKDWVGLEHVVPVRVDRNRGVYATAEGGQPPTAGQQRLEKLRIPMRYAHGSIQITKQLMESSKSSDGAFARAMQLEMDGLVDDLRVQRNFWMWGFGTGIRCLLNGEPGTDTRFEVDSPGGVAGADNGARFLNVGDHVVAINPVTGTLRAGGTREIVGIADDGTYADVATAIDSSWADNDYIVKAYGPDASITIQNTDWNHPFMGILGNIDDGTYRADHFGLSRATFPILQSFVLSNAGALSADLLYRAIHVAYQLGKCKINAHWMHPSVLRAYVRLMESDRRYQGVDLKRPDLGTAAASPNDAKSGMAFGGVDIYIDLDAPYGTWFGFDTRSWVRYVMNSGSWINEDGAILFRLDNAVDTFGAQYRIFDQFVVFNPNQSFRIDGIDTTIAVVHRV